MADHGEGVDAAPWWDVPYAPDGCDPEHTRFLRLHAAPERIPEGGVHATAVIMHGGYWKNKYGLDDAYGNAGTASLAPFFLSCGFAAVELEYRRRDHTGGGWPGTNEDILLALRRLAGLQLEVGAETSAPRRAAAIQALTPDRLLLVGHSAGGCLALWAAHELTEHGLQLEPESLRDIRRCCPEAPRQCPPQAAPPTGKSFVVEAEVASVREEPRMDANEVGLLNHGESICGELRDGWLHLDEASTEAHGLAAAAGACIPVDGAALGLGALLRPNPAGTACVARRRRCRQGFRVQAAAVLALAPVADLVRGHEMRISDEGDAVELYMGSPPFEASRDDYARASPAELLPVSFPLLVAFGADDKDVPPALVRGYAKVALESAPERVSVVEAIGADHFDVVNASSAAWLEQIVPALAAIAKQELSEEAAAALLGASALTLAP